MNKTCTLLGLITVALICAPTLAHEGPDLSCELHLEGHGEVLENLVEEAVEFESSLLDLETLCYGQRCLRDVQVLRLEFDSYIEDLLGQACGAVELIRRFGEFSSRETSLRASAVSVLKPDLTTASSPLRTILNFSENPAELPPNTPVELNNPRSSVRSVTFTDGVLPGFLKLAPPMQTKFLRSIFKGIVGPVDEAGIKQLSHIAKHLVEVKIYGEARLLGCLKDEKLIILRLLMHKKGSFTRYAALCD